MTPLVISFWMVTIMAIVTTVHSLLTAPEGIEDAAGFHYVD